MEVKLYLVGTINTPKYLMRTQVLILSVFCNTQGNVLLLLLEIKIFIALSFFPRMTTSFYVGNLIRKYYNGTLEPKG